MLKRLAWLDTQRLVVAILAISLFAMAVRAPADSDMWWHLAAGDWMRAQGRVPLADPFSHTLAGQRWIEQGWLPDVLTSLVFERLGYAGLGLLMALIVMTTLLLSFVQSRAGLFVKTFATLLAAIASAVYWSMRPQIFSFLFFAVTLYVLYRHKHGSRRIVWALPPLMLLWANCHAAWLSGYIAIGCYLLGESLNRLLRPAGEPAGAWRPLLELIGVAAVSLPFLALNPNGVVMLTYPFKTVGIGVLQQFIQEWAAPDFHQVYVQPFIWLLLLTVAAMALAGRRADFTHLITLAGFCYMALMAGRNIALFALVAGPLLATYGQEAIAGLWATVAGRYPRLARLAPAAAPVAGRRPALIAVNWAILALVVIAAGVKAVQPLSADFNEKLQAEQFPAGAVAFLRNHDLPGEMFNSYNWGGYLIWKLYPARRVFIDGRTDLYDDAFIRRYLAVTWAQDGWEDTLQRYHVGYVVIERQSFLAAYLALHPGWQEVYRDGLAVIYVRRDS